MDGFEEKHGVSGAGLVDVLGEALTGENRGGSRRKVSFLLPLIWV